VIVVRRHFWLGRPRGFRFPSGRWTIRLWPRRPGLSRPVRRGGGVSEARAGPSRSGAGGEAGGPGIPTGPGEPGGPPRRRAGILPAGPSPGTRVLAAFLAVVITAGLAVLFLDVMLWPTLRSLAEVELQNLAVGVMYKTVGEVIGESGISYEDLFLTQTDEQGRVTFLQPNMVVVNALSTRAAAAVREAVGRLEGTTLRIPIGRALGSRLLGGLGPRIPVTIHPLVLQDIRIWDDFEAQGINQTRHSVFIKVVLRSRTAIPFTSSEVTVENDFPVAEAVIVGPVPETYLGGGLLPYFPRLPGDG